MRLIVCAVAAGLLASCAATAPEPGKPTTVAAVCDQPDGSRVRLEGYIRYRRGLLSFCHATNGQTTDCDMALYADATPPADFNVMAPPPTGPEPAHARLTLKIGQSPGRMDDIPDHFSASDIKVHLDGGTTAGEGAHVRIDGKVSIIPPTPGELASSKSCWVDVDWAAPVA